MANGKIIKYRRVYKITLEGQTDTRNPDITPQMLKKFDMIFTEIPKMLNSESKSNNITVKDITNEDSDNS